MVERQQQLAHPRIFAACLDRDRSLSWCGKPIRWLEEHRYSLLDFEADQAGGSEDRGVNAPRLNLAEPCRNVSTQLYDIEVRPSCHQLATTSKTRRSDPRTRR